MNTSNVHNEALTDKYVELMNWNLSPEQKVNMYKVLKKMLERGGKVAKFNTTFTSYGTTRKYRFFVPSGMLLAKAERIVENTVNKVELQHKFVSNARMGREIQIALFGVS